MYYNTCNNMLCVVVSLVITPVGFSSTIIQFPIADISDCNPAITLL